MAIAARGVQFVDVLMVAGEYQTKPPLPFVPGGEGAGLLTPGPYAVAYHLIQAWCDEEGQEQAAAAAAGQRSATVGQCLVSALVAAGFALGCVASRAGWVAT